MPQHKPKKYAVLGSVSQSGRITLGWVYHLIFPRESWNHPQTYCGHPLWEADRTYVHIRTGRRVCKNCKRIKEKKDAETS